MAIPKLWISNETPPRVLFVKGVSGIDPDCLVAYAEGDESDPLWIVYDGDSKFSKGFYHVCAKAGAFKARPVRNDPVSALMASAVNLTSA